MIKDNTKLKIFNFFFSYLAIFLNKGRDFHFFSEKSFAFSKKVIILLNSSGNSPIT